MRLSPAQALDTFAAAYGPGLDLARAAAALAAVKAEELHAAPLPTYDSQISRRRIENRARPAVTAFELETGVTFAEAVAPSSGVANPSLGALCARLHQARVAHRDIGAIVGRNHRFVGRAIARHEARVASAKSLPSVGLAVAGERRRASHG